MEIKWLGRASLGEGFVTLDGEATLDHAPAAPSLSRMRVASAATKGFASEPAPEPGDFSLCIYCGSILVFTEKLALRMPTILELQEVEHDQAIQDAQRAWREAFAAKGRTQ